MIYSTLQYNNALLPNEMHPMHNQQIGSNSSIVLSSDLLGIYISDSYSDVPKFFDQNQVPNFSVENSFNAQNDPSIPSTSKTVTASTQHIKPIIKIEPTVDAVIFFIFLKKKILYFKITQATSLFLFCL